MKQKLKFSKARLACAVALGVGAFVGLSAVALFSDDNWISMNRSIPSADAPSPVAAAAVDSSGNLYIGGHFGLIADLVANSIAKWNGSKWTALGSGMDGQVTALALSGSDLYAGGSFGTAGGSFTGHTAL